MSPPVQTQALEYSSFVTSVLFEQNRVEKFLLRDSFSGLNLLPDGILWRRKEAFSDGVTSKEKSFRSCLQEHVESLVRVELFHLRRYSLAADSGPVLLCLLFR